VTERPALFGSIAQNDREGRGSVEKGTPTDAFIEAIAERIAEKVAQRLELPPLRTPRPNRYRRARRALGFLTSR
jgi:hypothetical protein